MLQTSILTLEQLKDLLLLVNESTYIKQVDLLSEATIGQHTRHIIELYQCLLQGYESGIICYDKRGRNKLVENHRGTAIQQIDQIAQSIEQPNKTLVIEYELNGNSIQIESNYFREVMYNLEHTIHHQALIKIGVQLLSDILLPHSFGVAPSTLQYRGQCVQ
ncbi:MAG: DinB family protein [Bacteroidota bacterium]|nr:DinB family protein [Bacteroidota bacterium]